MFKNSSAIIGGPLSINLPDPLKTQPKKTYGIKYLTSFIGIFCTFLFLSVIFTISTDFKLHSNFKININTFR
jgi:hypothetical protein